MKKQRPIKKLLLIVVTILALLYFGPSILQRIVVLMDRPGIQKVTSFKWPKGTKLLECQYASMQGTWVKVHLQLPKTFQCDTSKFTRFDPAYTNAFNPKTMNEDQWNRQRRVWRKNKGFVTLNSLKREPSASTNILFSASNQWADKTPWELVYDETIHQMWIFCY